MAPSPQLGGRWRLQGFPCSSRRTPCSCSQGIGRYSRGKAREFRLCFQQESQISEKFPVFSLSIRDMASETSSPQTAPTATQSAVAETSRPHPGTAREIPAIARGFGRRALVYPNRRLRVLGPRYAAARVFLRCQVGRFGFAFDSPQRRAGLSRAILQVRILLAPPPSLLLQRL